MFFEIKKILNNHGIERVGIIGIEDCEIINERILPKNAKSAILFAIPYRSSKTTENDGFSEYSKVYDYHYYCKMLYENVITEMNRLTGFSFYGFCDHSPINEKLAIAKCGLGMIGRNSLFIDYEYGSFVFIGSIITDMPTESIPQEIKSCNNCGKCIEACPNSAIIEKGIDRSKCLSCLSQKKTKTEKEKLLLKRYKVIWGCDTCQNVCPHNFNKKTTPIEYFEKSHVAKIDKDFIMKLTEEEFRKYAFAYKGRNLIINNIDFK